MRQKISFISIILIFITSTSWAGQNEEAFISKLFIEIGGTEIESKVYKGKQYRNMLTNKNAEYIKICCKIACSESSNCEQAVPWKDLSTMGFKTDGIITFFKVNGVNVDIIFESAGRISCSYILK